MAIKETEKQIQQAVAKYLDMRGWLWCHVPNEAKRSFKTAAILKSIGMKAGVPDVLIFTPPPRSAKHCGLAIELKSKKGKVSKYQNKWLDDLRIAGWATAVADSSNKAIGILQIYGY